MRSFSIALAGVLLVGCAYMPVLPDEKAAAFDTVPPFGTPAFETATVLVHGDDQGYGLRRTGGERGVVLGAEAWAWGAIREALVEKRLAARVATAGGCGEAQGLRILFNFVVEDDTHPFHRSFSIATLHAFPLWNMVRVKARAQCEAGERRLPLFTFEEEVLVYRSPVLLPLMPFKGREPVRRLLAAAGRAVASHVARELRLFRFPEVYQRETAADDEQP